MSETERSAFRVPAKVRTFEVESRRATQEEVDHMLVFAWTLLSQPLNQ